LNTQVSAPINLPSGKVQYDITGGTRAGTNLFHSFGDFNVPNNNIANFLNTQVHGVYPSTSNILGRVTGGNISNIFGTIQTTNFGNANLFLMNPAGFLFGPNATLNVGGMVAFTTADYLRLADGALFNAIPNAAADALLSAAPVAAFGFLGSNPGAITVQGSHLSVTPGQSLSLVGGNITVQSGTLDDGTVRTAQLSAQGGQINLASVASPGEILAGTLAQAPNITGQSFGALGTVQVLEQSVIDASGNGGGTVLIRGGQFLLDNSTISANIKGPGPNINGAESIGGGIDIQVSENAVIQNLGVLETNVTGNATPGVTYGGVHVKADRIEILGTLSLEDAFAATDPSVFSAFTGIRSDVRPGSTGGNSGAITLDANSILINNFATLESITSGAGNAGNIIAKANQNIDFDFAQVQSSAQPSIGNAGEVVFSTGDAGNVTLSSAQGNITLTNETSITSQTAFSPGTAGNLTLSAPNGNILLADSVLFTFINPPFNEAGVPAVRAGGSGGILINANNLDLNGSNIAITNLSNLPSGDITVNLSGSLSLHGGRFAPSSINAFSVGVFVNGTNGGELVGGGSSAGMNIRAHDILITDGGSLTTDTNNSGAAGPINISAVNLQLTNGGFIASRSNFGFNLDTGLPVDVPPSGPAGTVTIQGLAGPAASVLIDGAGSGILTNTEGTGAGGNINILTQSLTVQNGGTLSAATSGTAPSASGGTILVKADTVTLASGGTMTAASTGSGAAGEVIVQGLASPAQSILIDGFDEAGNASGIFTNTQGSGTGGNIMLNANSVTLQNGGTLSAQTTGSGNAGNILVKADTVNMTGGAQMTSSSVVGVSGEPPTGNAGNVTIQGLASPAQSVLIDGSSVSTETQGSGAGGIISIDAKTINAANFAFISTVSSGSGQAGDIVLKATDAISMSDSFVNSDAASFSTTVAGSGGRIHLNAPNINLQDSLLSTSTLGAGNAGNVLLEAQQLNLNTGSHVSAFTQGPGQGGSITIQGLDGDGSRALDVTISGGSTLISRTSNVGNAGDIAINAARLTLTESSQVNANSETGTGAGGNILVNANTVTLQNGGTLSAATSGTAPTATGGTITVNADHVALNNRALISTDTNGIAPAGVIEINTGSLAINGGSQIKSSSGAEQAVAPALFAAPAAPLTGGTITVQGRTGAGTLADSVTIDGTSSGIFTQSTGNRPGGDISIHTSGSATLTNGASVSASSTGAGNAGNILINAGNQFTMTNSTVTTEADAASGGTIKIGTNPNGTVQLTNSTISASVLDGTGGGGSVNIDPQSVLLLNSQILANAVFGPGGNISITTNLLLPDANSVISASSQFGQQGTITIQSPIAPASRIIPLSQKPLIATSLLSQRCAALAGGNYSSFTVAGRDSLPAEPSGWLASPLAALSEGSQLEPRAQGVAIETGEGRPPLAPPYQGGGEGETLRTGERRETGGDDDLPIVSLRRIAPPGFLTQSFATDWSAGCTS
jgi:filamentous hemagglutinin family protein